MKTALFIGRFQPFHLGHLDVVKQALSENDFLIIGIGSAEKSYLPENPFTASERWQMITAALDEAKIPREKYTIIPVRNIDNYALWVEHVSQIVPPFQTVYTGSPIVEKLFKDHGKYEIKIAKIKLQTSATMIRKQILTGKNWEKSLPKATAKYLKKIDTNVRLKSIRI